MYVSDLTFICTKLQLVFFLFCKEKSASLFSLEQKHSNTKIQFNDTIRQGIHTVDRIQQTYGKEILPYPPERIYKLNFTFFSLFFPLPNKPQKPYEPTLLAYRYEIMIAQHLVYLTVFCALHKRAISFTPKAKPAFAELKTKTNIRNYSLYTG